MPAFLGGHNPLSMCHDTQVSVGGLLGGHSGLMIAEGRGNALVLLVRTLR